MNLAISKTTEISLYKLIYNFKLLINLNFIIGTLDILFFNIYIEAEKAIVFTVMIMKKHYNKKYILKFFNLEDKVTL